MELCRLEFDTVKDFTAWLIDNEGSEILDDYGRRWKYEKYCFYFKDLGRSDKYEEGLKCLHLFQTRLWWTPKR